MIITIRKISRDKIRQIDRGFIFVSRKGKKQNCCLREFVVSLPTPLHPGVTGSLQIQRKQSWAELFSMTPITRGHKTMSWESPPSPPCSSLVPTSTELAFSFLHTFLFSPSPRCLRAQYNPFTLLSPTSSSHSQSHCLLLSSCMSSGIMDQETSREPRRFSHLLPH